MKQIKRIFYVLLLCSYNLHFVTGQETIPATCGTATGTGGSVTFTIGQVTYNTYTGTSGSVAQGVQQPYEISVVTAIENTEYITLECIVYPNPTEGIIRLIIKSFDDDNMRFRLFDMNGVLLQDNKIEDKETKISMENLSAAVYVLKVIKDRIEVKTFKIVKN